MRLEIQDLTALYHEKNYAALNVSFGCEENELLGIAGPSGAGKSTLGRCIAGLQSHRSGRITADGELLKLQNHRSARTYRRTVQFVFQDPLASLPPHLPVRIPLMDAAALSPHQDRRTALARLLEELNLEEELLARRPGEMSGGQRQRIALARALIVEPRFVVLDEVTSALDTINERRILDLLASYRARHGLGVIFISHDIGLLFDVCDRILIYHCGRIIESGQPAELFAKPEHSITRDLLSSLPWTRRSGLLQRFQIASPKGEN